MRVYSLSRYFREVTARLVRAHNQWGMKKSLIQVSIYMKGDDLFAKVEKSFTQKY